MTTTQRPRKSHAPTNRAIRNEREYAGAIGEIEELLDRNPKLGTASHDRLELLSILAEAWERDRDTEFGDSSPQELVEFMAEQKQIARGELADMMGGRSRLSDFLSGKRRLSITQLETLSTTLGIPAGLLLESTLPRS